MAIFSLRRGERISNGFDCQVLLLSQFPRLLPRLGEEEDAQSPGIPTPSEEKKGGFLLASKELMQVPKVQASSPGGLGACPL